MTLLLKIENVTAEIRRYEVLKRFLTRPAIWIFVPFVACVLSGLYSFNAVLFATVVGLAIMYSMLWIRLLTNQSIESDILFGRLGFLFVFIPWHTSSIELPILACCLRFLFILASFYLTFFSVLLLRSKRLLFLIDTIQAGSAEQD